MLGLDAAGKTTILYKLHIGEILSTVPTIGDACLIAASSSAILMLLPGHMSATIAGQGTMSLVTCSPMQGCALPAMRLQYSTS